jgi:hypothetical protein
MKWLLATGFIFCSYGSPSQTLEETIARQLESMNEEDQTETDEMPEEEWAALIRHPVDINRADAIEWNLFPFITAIQINSLTRYRQLFGNLLSVYELQAVPHWNADDLEKIKPYITVASEEGILNWKNLWKGESLLLLRNKIVLEKKKGFIQKENGYTGSPHHVLISYRYRYRKWLDAGLLFEKDPGEILFGKQIKTFDFFSFHIYKRGSGIIKAIALGDFRVNYGQGLIHWQSRSFGKGSMVTAIKKEAAAILPYASANEINFHRGVGFILERSRLQGTVFFSSQKQSSAIHADSIDFFTGINSSGYHRTETELSHRKKLRYSSAGMSLHYAADNYRAGINMIHHRYSASLQPAVTLYNMYDQKGRALSNASFDYELTFRNMHFFGELAVDQQFSPALVAGLLAAADRNLDLSIVFRSLAKDFRATGARAFTESSAAENETGFYTGLVFRPTEAWKIEGYFDFFRFPWLKYRIDRPSSGSDYLVTFTWKPTKVWEIYCRLKAKYMEINTDPGSKLHETTISSRKSLKIYLRNMLSMNTTLKFAAETVWYAKARAMKEEGFLAYAELSFKPLRNISGNFRATYFETPGFDSRIYTYESGLSGEIPFQYGSGFRYYLNTRLIINKTWTIAFRFSQTLFSEKGKTGSGLEGINGSRLTKLEMQAQYAF